ncbi:FMN-binding negative transcriptional regulator [Pseudoalteromonas ulvae]|uniref:Transcriptional regulator n=1 Tax=Pseudoalteromonas ulvae TaxID=107327 RepID=A0A244CP06_PSEDV|nr:FMN-binding negative transcriptional regulator [Pseudoalteromonas ulvae]OUL57361.1 hypothetical protein B1199_14445 [Pseudoalteromonas ulvae]
MYPSQHYQSQNLSLLLHIIEQSPLATLLFNQAGEQWPHISHIPFIFDQGMLIGHISRLHPLANQLTQGDVELKLIFNGPDGYISPLYSPDAQTVPTWNYAKVVVTGQASIVSDKTEQGALMAQISHHFEQQLHYQFSAEPWSIDTLPAKHLDAMINAISIFKVAICRTEGNIKLSQNKPPLAIEAMTKHLKAHQQPDLAALMNRAQS